MANFGSFQHNFDAPYGIGVVSGRFPKLHGVQKFGYNPAVPSNAYETVWDGSSLYVYPDAADYVEIVCDDGTIDFSGGTGARSVTIEGLDANYDVATETITIGGSAGSTSFIRVYRAVMKTANTGNANVGDITITVSSTAVAKIQAGYGQSLMCVYTVPRNYIAYLMQIDIGSSKDLENEIRFITKEISNGNVWNTRAFITTRGGFIEKNYVIPIKIEEKTDIELIGKASATSSISGGFELVLQDLQE